MKQILSFFLAILLLGLAGCGSTEEQPGDGRLVVYTSIYPLYNFAGEIAGDKADVRQLAPAGEPHDWEPTPTDITALERADVFIYNGAGLEHWVDRVLDALQNDKLVVVEASHGIALLDGDSHDHDDDHDDEDHDQEGEEGHGHNHGGVDPHVWLSPVNAIQQAAAIADALAQADPDNAEYYRQRLADYTARLEALDQSYREALAPYQGREIVVAHQAFGYLCEEYGLKQTAVQGYSNEGDPDLAQMARIVDFVREHGVTVVFFEDAASPAVAQAIARETGARTDVLNPLESLSGEQEQNGADYITVMEQNLEALLAALE